MNYSWMKKFISVISAVSFAVPFGSVFSEMVYAADSCEITETFAASASDDDMFLKYAEEVLDMDLNPSDDGEYNLSGSINASYGSFGTGLTSSMNSNEKVIYNSLKSNLLKVADGTISETVFKVTGLNLTGTTSNRAFSDNVSHMKIMHYLLADMPYELYWFDKTSGIKVAWSAQQSGGVYTVTEVTFSFMVSKDYSVGGVKDSTSADTSKTGAIKNTAANARAVVSQNAGKTDYEKLIAYREYICSQVSYNHDAVDNNYDYGDPWQLVYAFDNDPSTNIVCEGYSKAFQYLCELSDFSGEVICRSVSGSMGGPHMWNIVSIGGKNYLVDITNCDDGTIGSPDKLFFKGMSGSVSAGYSRTISSRTVKYTYDSDMKDLYGTASLTLSSVDYDGVTSVPKGDDSYNQNPEDFSGNINSGVGSPAQKNDNAYSLTGYGSVEGYVNTNVLKVVLPTQSLDFTLDPQGLIKKSGASRYSQNTEFKYSDKDDGFVFFRTLSSSGNYEYADSISLSAYNKSSYPVDISASASFTDLSGKVITDTDGLYDISDKNTSIYFSVTDTETNQMVSLEESSAAVLDSRRINDVKQAYSFKYGRSGYEYSLDENALRSDTNPYGMDVPEYSVILNASCNPYADWTGVSMKNAKLSVVWTVTGAS